MDPDSGVETPKNFVQCFQKILDKTCMFLYIVEWCIKAFQVSEKKTEHQNKNYSLLDSIIGSSALPDFMLKWGIRYLVKQRIKTSYHPDPEIRQEKFKQFIDDLKKQPIAVNTRTVNAQHYELPPEFFEVVLGHHLKYSCAYFKSKKDSLDDAELNMLDKYIQRAQIKNNDKILELGCGWGSLTLHIARKFPNSKITAISNSRLQKNFINQKLKSEKIKNVSILTKDINHFDTSKKFDKIISIEMFEHARNYEKLFQKVRKFLKKGGLVFIHIFAHKEMAYPFNAKDDSDWMSKYFFTGGVMPSSHLFTYFIHPLKIKNHWVINGKQYYHTSCKWLENIDKNKEKIMQIFKSIYGKEYKLWYQYWRIFFMAVAELFGYKKGSEWVINHYLFEKP